MSDKDILNFLKDEVDNKIGSNDIKSEKIDNNSNVFLGPGPSLSVIAKAAELYYVAGFITLFVRICVAEDD